MGLGLGLLGAGALGVRYFIAVVGTYGITSPLTWNPVSARYVVGQTLAWDSFRFSIGLNRLLGVGMENVSVSPMGALRPEDVEFREPPPPDPADTVVLSGLVSEGVDSTARSGAEAPAPAGPGWTVPGGDDFRRRRSALASIDRGNVADLRVVHEVDAAAHIDDDWISNTEAPPLVSGSVVYWITAGERLVATDVVSGETLWHRRLPAFGYSRRGFLVRERVGRSPVLYVPFGPMMAAVDGSDGRLLPGFGRGGVARLPGPTMVAPLLRGDEVVVAVYDPQQVAALDVETGALRWSVPLHPESRNFRGGAPWAGLALDGERDLLFVTTGNPRPALSGLGRPGDNENSNSILAIDLTRREIRWAFQEVRHDLWDFDVPSGPILSTVEVGGRRWDVVIAVTKIGNTLILDRDSGRPLFDLRLRRAPGSTFVRERTADYQLDLRRPEPLIDIAFDPSLITDVTDESTRFVERQIANGRTLFGRFVPPALNRDVITFGVHGGAEWHGASVDPEGDRLYVAVNMIPWALRLYALTEGVDRPEGLDESEVYTERCAGCHLASRDGEYVERGEVAVRFVPSLHGYTFDDGNRALFTTAAMDAVHGDRVAEQGELEAIWEVFERWDRTLLDRGALRLFSRWRQIVDQDGRPGSAPPWGKIVALHLGTGNHAWEVPFGEKTVAGRARATGSPSYGGLISSAGGLIFATGTDDGYVRALDEDTGEVLWRHRMAAAGSAPPITFTVDGRQYVAVVSTGGKFHNFVDRASRLYLFALPAG